MKRVRQMRHAYRQIYDLGHTDGSYYIAMEYIAGVGCAVWDRARRRNRLCHCDGAYIMQKVAEGLALRIAKKMIVGMTLV